MKKIYLELTDRCNLNCRFCYRQTWTQPPSDMDPTIVDACIQEIKSMDNVEEVVLGGIGEPTYFQGIEEVIEELKDKKITMTSNGASISDALAKICVQHVDHLIISVDGMDETFYALRQFPLQELIKNVDKIVALKEANQSSLPKISFQMVLTTMNMHEIKDVIDLAARHGVAQVILSNIVPTQEEDLELVPYFMYEKEPLHSIIKAASTKALIERLELHIPETRLKTERYCRFIEEDSMMVNVKGQVVPCYRFAHDGTEFVFGRKKDIKMHSFGTVPEQSLREIWNQPAYVNYRSIVHNNHYPSCMDCDLVDGCDMARNAEFDCFGNTPSCADCLWGRKIVYCV